MDPAIKKVVVVLAAALIVVIGAILLTGSVRDKAAATTGNDINPQKTPQMEALADAKPIAKQEPLDGAEASDADADKVAQIDDDAQGNEMYEGAIAGLSEEEIAKMALAEEESAARTETTGAEDAVD